VDIPSRQEPPSPRVKKEANMRTSIPMWPPSKWPPSNPDTSMKSYF
jgi:hypothetical protein